MRRSRPDLIVPIRDRRQRRRILTLKNFRNACFVLVVLVGGMAIEANLRDRKPQSDFGRLYSGRIETATTVAKHPDVVQPAEPIEDHDAADPMLVQAAARSQILRDEPKPVEAKPVVVPAAPAPAPLVPDSATSHVAIVGGPEGVKVVQRQRERPVLGGGFGRSQ